MNWLLIFCCFNPMNIILFHLLDKIFVEALVFLDVYVVYNSISLYSFFVVAFEHVPEDHMISKILLWSPSFHWVFLFFYFLGVKPMFECTWFDALAYRLNSKYVHVKKQKVSYPFFFFSFLLKILVLV